MNDDKFDRHSVLHRDAPDIELESESVASDRPRGWLPVLTDVVELGDLAPADATLAPVPYPVEPVAEAAVPDLSPLDFPAEAQAGDTETAPGIEEMPEPEPAEPDFPAPELTAPAAVGTPATADQAALAEALMAELAPRIVELVDERIATALRSSLDDTLGALLPQLDATLHEVVRDVIAEKLGQTGTK